MAEIEIQNINNPRSIARDAIIQVKKEQLGVEIHSTVAGAQGENLYQIAVRNGYRGTEADFIHDLLNGVGNGFYNVDNLHPLSEGYYTLETAIAATAADTDVPTSIKSGMVIMFNNGTKWMTYRYRGIYSTSDTDADSKFLNTKNWEDLYEGQNITMSEYEYERMDPEDIRDDKYYFTYEDEEEIPARVENGVLYVGDSIEDHVLYSKGKVKNHVLTV